MEPESLRRWLNGAARLVKPDFPPDRGRLTIADVRDLAEPAADAQAVERWARSTWEAYASLHGLAREWVRQAHETQARPRPAGAHGDDVRPPGAGPAAVERA